MWDRRAAYLSHHDGDTVTMMLDQGFGDRKMIDVRLFGVFAPELKQLGGPETRDFVKEWIQGVQYQAPKQAWPFVVTTIRMKVADREQKTLDRYLGIVTTADASSNLNVLVSQFVRENGYPGGTGS